MTVSDICLVLCTCPDNETAAQIARAAVEQKHAACVSILPGLTSVYSWQGEIEQDSEVQLLIKTTKRNTDALYKLALSLHPYDEPEWLIVDIAGGAATYLNWIKSSTE
ncbi:divalent-cation tolerance protein CutA [Lacimicrobium alkaliphilum]|uniref:Divalent-cation tolerance protein CutA n=1 Tax=Lacimicrobium alkaliphilum TaxID=1526571 RepID=A0ABQ1RJL7_9ALTE|nr:divalent-cation tolerance protein CutA [Lacimicrobium alkaliphilum]GGD70110.1 divalent-cation tolerance protein CutA [Lacimicrobium alkaliphilum]